MAKNIDDSKLSYRRKVRFELPKSGNSNQSSPSSPPVLITVTEHRPPTTTHSFHSATTKKHETKVHGTGNYVNGTLNWSTNDYSLMPPGKTQSKNSNNNSHKNNNNNNSDNECIKSEVSSRCKRIITFRNQLTNDASAKYARKNCSTDQQYWDNAISRRGILLHVSSENQSTDQIKFRNNRMHRYTSILMKPLPNSLRRTSSSSSAAAGHLRFFHRSKTSPINTSNTLELPTLAQQLNKMQPKPKLMRNPFERFSYKLISIKKPTSMRTQVNVIGGNDDDDDDDSNNNDLLPTMQSVSSVDFTERALSIVRQNGCALSNSQCELEHHCTSQNLSEILQNLNRWQCTTTTATATAVTAATTTTTPHTIPTNDNHLRGAFNHSVEFCTLKKLDVKQ